MKKRTKAPSQANPNLGAAASATSSTANSIVVSPGASKHALPAISITRLMLGIALLVLVVGGAYLALHHRSKQTAQTAPKGLIVSDGTDPKIASQPTYIARQKSNQLFSLLEQYAADHSGVYPGDINVATFSAQKPSADIFKLPKGYEYAYTPDPAGCSTAANNCTNFKLDVIKTADKSVLYSQSAHASNWVVPQPQKGK